MREKCRLVRCSRYFIFFSILQEEENWTEINKQQKPQITYSIASHIECLFMKYFSHPRLYANPDAVHSFSLDTITLSFSERVVFTIVACHLLLCPYVGIYFSLFFSFSSVVAFTIAFCYCCVFFICCRHTHENKKISFSFTGWEYGVFFGIARSLHCTHIRSVCFFFRRHKSRHKNDDDDDEKNDNDACKQRKRRDTRRKCMSSFPFFFCCWVASRQALESNQMVVLLRFLYRIS